MRFVPRIEGLKPSTLEPGWFWNATEKSITNIFCVRELVKNVCVEQNFFAREKNWVNGEFTKYTRAKAI